MITDTKNRTASRRENTFNIMINHVEKERVALSFKNKTNAKQERKSDDELLMMTLASSSYRYTACARNRTGSTSPFLSHLLYRGRRGGHSRKKKTVESFSFSHDS